MDLATHPHDCNNFRVAMREALAGRYVFPCHGKQPAPGVMWSAQSTNDPEVVWRFWERFPGAAPSIDNARSGLLVADADRDGDMVGETYLSSRSPDPLDDIPGSRTPSGGRHLFFRNIQPPLGNGRGSLPPKASCNCDIKGAGGYVLAPGADTTAWGGGIYEPIGDLGDIPPCPKWLLEELTPKPWERKANGAAADTNGASPHKAEPAPELTTDPRGLAYGEAALRGIEADLAKASAADHNLNDTCNVQAFKAGRLVGGGYFDQGEAYRRLAAVARDILGIPLGDRVYGPQGTIARAIGDGMADPRRLDQDEDGPKIDFEHLRSGKQGLHANGADRGADKGAETPATPLVVHKPYVIVGAANVPLRPWVYGKLLIRKNVTMTVAPGGMGKSSLVIVESLAQASGKPLLGIAPKRPLRVAYWNLEDPYDELVHRFEAAVLHYKLTQEDIEGRLFVNSGRDTPLIVAETTRGEARILRPVIDALVAENKAKEIDVLVLDPYVSCNRVPENDNSAQNAIINEWGVVADRSNCAVHLVDHTRKMGGPEFEVTAESQRGAVAKRDASRVTRVLNQMTKEDGDNFGVDYLLHFRTDKGKHNMSPPEKAVWHKIWNINLRNDPDAVMVDGVRCAEDDEVGVVVRWELPNAFDGVTGADFDKVAAVIRSGEWRENVRAANWVGLAIAEGLGLDVDLPADKGRIKRLLKGYLKEGSLVVVEKVDASRHVRQFIEVAEKQQ